MTSQAPAIEHIVFLSAVSWDHCLAARTRRLAEWMSRLGRDVTFVELPGTRATLRRFRHPVTRNAENVRVKRLWPLPGYLRFADTAPAALWRRYAVRRLRRAIPNPQRTALIISTPWWTPIAKELSCRAICYDYIDHVRVHSFGRNLKQMAAWEQGLLRAADLVVPVTGYLESLLPPDGPGQVTGNPNGADDGWLTQSPPPVPREQLTDRPDAPIVGFLGALFEWVDQELLVAASEALPEAQFVLVGPTRRGVRVDSLATRPNVRLFPAQRYADVPKWIAAFDVCLIPFRRDEVTAASDPVKLYEYLVLGKPVVSSRQFGSADDPPPLFVGESPDAFVAAIREAIDQRDDIDGARRGFATRHTWKSRAETFLGAIDRRTPPEGACP